MEIIRLIGEGRHITWFADSSHFISWDGNIIQLWSVEGNEIDRFRFHRLHMIESNPKHSAILLGGTMTNGEPEGIMINNAGQIIGRIQPYFKWSPNGEHIAGFFKDSEEEKKIWIWKLSYMKPEKEREIKLKKAVSIVSWGFERDLILFLNREENKGYILDLNTGKIKETVKIKGIVTQIVWSPYENLIMTGSKEGELKMWSLIIDAKGKVKKKEEFRKKFESPIIRILWRAPERVFIKIGREIYLLNTTEKELIKCGEGRVFDVSLDMNYIAIGEKGTVNIYGLKSGELKVTIETHGEVKDVKFSPNSQYLVIASTDYTLRILERMQDF